MVGVKERCRVEDYATEGPRPEIFSKEPEVSCQILHTFKNAEALCHQHHFDVLMSTETLKVEFLSDVRRAVSVSILFYFVCIRLS